ncbi:MAG: hypothetical protein KH436_08930 [Firmicutes bacterium]|nr:hypothetical protein [Bacillota bacterium]
MLKIKKITNVNFKEQSFDLILGENTTYNVYYEIFDEEKNLKIGIQCFDTGIAPQIGEYGNEILIGVSNKFYIIGKNTIIKEIDIEACFFEFMIIKDVILIVNETSLIMLDEKYNEKWTRYFSEIVGSVNILDCKIEVRDIADTIIMIQLETGDIVN